MDDTIRRALDHDQVVDLTTTGRRSGEPRRIEIFLHSIDGRLVISGMPSRRTRAWIRNIAADPRVTLHLKGPRAQADLPATARIVTDPVERRELIVRVARTWHRTDVDTMVELSPLIELTLSGNGAVAAA